MFLTEYKEVKQRLRQELKILGDKAYVGLEKENVQTSNMNVFNYPQYIKWDKV